MKLEIKNNSVVLNDKQFAGFEVIKDGKKMKTGENRVFPFSELSSFKVWCSGDMKKAMIKLTWRPDYRSKKIDPIYRKDMEIYELDEKMGKNGQNYMQFWTYKMDKPVINETPEKKSK